MQVRQPSYSWIGVLVLIVLVGAVLFGAGFTQSDLVNPLRSGVSADATRTALAQDSSDHDLRIRATTTAIARNDEAALVDATRSAQLYDISLRTTSTSAANALAAEATQTARLNKLSYQATATSVAISAQTTQRALQASSSPAVANLQSTPIEASASLLENSIWPGDKFSMIVLAVLVAALSVTLVATCRLYSRARSEVATYQARRFQQSTQLAQAQAHMYEMQAAMLRETRRNAQMAATVQSASEQRYMMPSFQKFSNRADADVENPIMR